ncbi:putative RNA-binding protein 19 [Coelomomyces lativittatus]|nr:putative RNA-binding protein 19 [Coelomomyces lativittatus]
MLLPKLDTSSTSSSKKSSCISSSYSIPSPPTSISSSSPYFDGLPELTSSRVGSLSTPRGVMVMDPKRSPSLIPSSSSSSFPSHAHAHSHSNSNLTLNSTSSPNATHRFMKLEKSTTLLPHSSVMATTQLPCSFSFPSQQEPKTNVYLSNLSLTINEPLLEQIFSKFGPIGSCKVLRTPQGVSRKIAFVNFIHASSAQDAVNSVFFVDSKQIRVSFALNDYTPFTHSPS